MEKRECLKMYDMIIIKGTENYKIKEHKVRDWLNSFTGEILDIKMNGLGNVIIFYDDVRRV